MVESGRVRQNSYGNHPEDQVREIRINRRAETVVVDFYTEMVFDGRMFAVQIGTVDAAGGVNSTGAAPADTLVWALTDVENGNTIIPVVAQVAVETWTSSLLVNFMLEADMGKIRFSSGGGVFTALNMRGDSPRNAASISHVNLTSGAGVTALAKSTIGGIDGSHEFYQHAIEVNVGNAADAATDAGLTWRAKDAGGPPVIVGPGSFVFHLAASNADITATGHYHFIELPTESVT